jgi:hypothetical protein
MIPRHPVRSVLVVLLVLLGLTACGASARTKTLRVNLVALNTARDAVLAISKEREKQLYDGCSPPTCTKEEGHTRVDAWQKKVDVAVTAIDLAYKATHDAGLLGDAKSAADAATAAKKALDVYEQLKKEIP